MDAGREEPGLLSSPPSAFDAGPASPGPFGFWITGAALTGGGFAGCAGMVEGRGGREKFAALTNNRADGG